MKVRPRRKRARKLAATMEVEVAESRIRRQSSPPGTCASALRMIWNSLDSLLKEAKPDLVIWQAGTVDAMRGVETDTFRNELQDGVETLQNGGADVVLMNPLHPDAARVPPLVTRPFSFADCLHTPPMMARYSGSPVEE